MTVSPLAGCSQEPEFVHLVWLLVLEIGLSQLPGTHPAKSYHTGWSPMRGAGRGDYDSLGCLALGLILFKPAHISRQATALSSLELLSQMPKGQGNRCCRQWENIAQFNQGLLLFSLLEALPSKGLTSDRFSLNC